MSTKKLDELKSIEKQIQATWEDAKVFEEDAPAVGVEAEKFMATFPFPYMNGRLHLGHTFTISKSEIAVRFQRLEGKRCQFPFGFHASGMPIKASSGKLIRESELYGTPPVFPDATLEELVQEVIEVEIRDKSRSKKSKQTNKTGGFKYQWQIMQDLGFDDEEIVKFKDTGYWLDYFPPAAKSDLQRLGLHTDWRRSFITTDRNPYFNSFVRWQFLRLKDRSKLAFGKRNSIYSPLDGQPCMDHDRASGEGVGPQEYTLVKLRVLALPKALSSVSTIAKSKDKVYLVAATLRPETMYGQTNCWLGPDIMYVAVRSRTGDVLVCTPRSARNMAYQMLLEKDNVVDVLVEVQGSDLMGVKLSAPFCPYDSVYTLPMMTVKDNKGTGVVTSVPSDSPDDFAALTDLQNKPALCEKYGITPDMIDRAPVPIINVPEYGTLSAPLVCEQLGIKSQNDKVKLAEAKEKVYLKGFYEGTLLVGKFAGSKVQNVKKGLQDILVAEGSAVLYQEPEKMVISRSGDECVVALCDQWYLKYGEEGWKAQANQCLANLDTFHDEVRKNFEYTMDWLKEYACSRTFGLGTKLPWDEKWLIESLSDSTIYMAYYTVAHMLHTDINGHQQHPQHAISAEHMTPEVWDYIFCQADKPPKTAIKPATLATMRREFEFWYPVDLRVSGKDLIQNHLTYYIYNHCAIWTKKPEMWPQAIRANGHLMLNSNKMSKSTGNFMTLSEGLDKYGADATRLALADAGDSIEDANFETSVAESAVLRLYTGVELARELLAEMDKMRSGTELNLYDCMFEAEMSSLNSAAHTAYHSMLFKEALRTCYYEYNSAFNAYRERCSGVGMRRETVMSYLTTQVVMLSPICPHVCDYTWTTLLGNTSSVVVARWPQAPPSDAALRRASAYLADVSSEFRRKFKASLVVKPKKGVKAEDVKPANCGTIYMAKTYPEWQNVILATLSEMYAKNGDALPENKVIAKALGGLAELKKFMKKVMPFAQMLKERSEKLGKAAFNTAVDFDEENTVTSSLEYLRETIGLEKLDVKWTHEEGTDSKVEATPGKPFLALSTAPSVSVRIVNPQQASSLFTYDVAVFEKDTASCVSKRLVRMHKAVKTHMVIALHRYSDPVMGPRTLPSLKEPLAGTAPVVKAAQFTLKDGALFLDGTPLGHMMLFTVSS